MRPCGDFDKVTRLYWQWQLKLIHFCQTVVQSGTVPVEIWHNHTYSKYALRSLKNILQGTANLCFPIPSDRPLMFFVEKTVFIGDVKVNIQGRGLQCVPSTCPGETVLVLQTGSSCNADGRSPFCGHPERCIPDIYDNDSCTFTCKCKPAPRARYCNLRIAVYFKLDAGKAYRNNPPQLCSFHVWTRPFYGIFRLSEWSSYLPNI